jgi:hypothetical protein
VGSICKIEPASKQWKHFFPCVLSVSAVKKQIMGSIFKIEPIKNVFLGGLCGSAVNHPDLHENRIQCFPCQFSSLVVPRP